jgi:hypothetical protein
LYSTSFEAIPNSLTHTPITLLENVLNMFLIIWVKSLQPYPCCCWTNVCITKLTGIWLYSLFSIFNQCMFLQRKPNGGGWHHLTSLHWETLRTPVWMGSSCALFCPWHLYCGGSNPLLVLLVPVLIFTEILLLNVILAIVVCFCWIVCLLAQASTLSCWTNAFTTLSFQRKLRKKVTLWRFGVWTMFLLNYSLA